MTMFDTRTLLAALIEMKAPAAFLLNTFFRTTPSSVSLTEYVDIDIEKHLRKLAPFVHPLAPGTVENREGYTTNTFKPPYVKPKRPISAADLLKRMAGENPYLQRSMMERAAALTMKDLMEMDQELTRREEWMAAQQLTTGSVVVSGEGVSATIDMQWSATHLLANTALTANGWDQSGANPIADQRLAARLIVQDSGLTPTHIIYGSDAWDLYINDDTVQAFLDKRHINPGDVRPELPMPGAMLQGRWLGVEHWTYEEWYLDENGTEQPMIPADYVIVGSNMARAERHYGAILDPKAPPGVRAFPKSWEEEDPPVRYVMLQAAPLPVAHQVDGFVRMDVKG